MVNAHVNIGVIDFRKTVVLPNWMTLTILFVC